MDESFNTSLGSFGLGGTSELSSLSPAESALRSVLLNCGILEDIHCSSLLASTLHVNTSEDVNESTNQSSSLTLRDVRRIGPLGHLSEDVQTVLLGSTLHRYSEDAPTAMPRQAAPTLGATLESWGSFRASLRTANSTINSSSDAGHFRATLERLLEDTANSINSESENPPGVLDVLAGSLRGSTVVDQSTLSNDQETLPMAIGNRFFNSTLSLRSQGGDGTTLDPMSITGGISVMAILRRIADGESSLSDEDAIVRSSRRVLQMGTVLSGARLTDDEIEALPKVRFGRAEEQQCSICLENFISDDLLTELPCAHFFHVDCVARWFHSSTQCPLCRGTLL
eukprot:TRINITY_DN46408_c0_g1_i1.p1 TRINITY_DN46408_c0_g1~~TRINITY_DN46408_c0_g1_i1.p1  ORF type:complete len:340 (+),score=52.31 TRINITY_DN46408_c0_g1_i1:198-1217(+)